LSKLADRISRTTTTGKGDILGVLTSLEEEIVESLKDGNIVELGKLCIFYPNVKSSGAESKESFNLRSSNAKKSINIRAKKSLSDQMQDVELQQVEG
jgi:nucleoid DNA-binding protein